MKKSNRKLRKVLLVTCCALALVAISVGATLAYLTDTEAVTNVFTVGQVGITLDEGKVHELGEEGTTDANVGTHTDEGATRVTENKYRIIPGMTYDKDPTIHLTADTNVVDYQDAYVVAKITVNKGKELLSLLPADQGTIGIKGIVTGGVLNETYTGPVTENGIWSWENSTAILTQTMESDNIIFMVYWKNPQTPGTDLKIFEKLVIPQNWDNDDIDDLQGMEIKVNAYAIQAAGFDDVKAAFAAGEWN